MSKKKLIFIPFQDEFCFENEGILTREYAMLQLLTESGLELDTVVNKPRTLLDSKSIAVDGFNFPCGSVESDVLSKLNVARSLSPKRLLSLSQVTRKRGWWVDSYLDALGEMSADMSDTVVYTNSPFSWKLVKKLKESGAFVVFDSMDNMMTYTHFRASEKTAARTGYEALLGLADYACANSQRTVDCFKDEFDVEVELVKNGVFEPRPIDCENIPQVEEIAHLKKHYGKCAGFIGKFGLRIDHQLIDVLAHENPDCLFVFVGLELKGQCDAFNSVVASNENVVKLPAVPSAYLYPVLDQFDLLMIPYSVGKNENSGDPLKLYQYFMAGRPIACTPIREVGEYSDLILVSGNHDDWSKLLSEIDGKQVDYSSVTESVLWASRAHTLLASIGGIN